MSSKLLVALSLAVFSAAFGAEELASTPPTENKEVAPTLRFKAKAIDGEEVDLAKYKGLVLVVVNVASECGVTPQYEQLQALHEAAAERGLRILGFPCNDFGKQEPGGNEEIRAFCDKNYGVTFDMFAKVAVKGEDACEFYKLLSKTDAKPKESGEISWNFEKIVIGRDGNVRAHFESHVEPRDSDFLRVLKEALDEEVKDDSDGASARE